MSDERVNKLPVWAQKLIRGLWIRLNEANQTIARERGDREPSACYVQDHNRPGLPFYVGDLVHIEHEGVELTILCREGASPRFIMDYTDKASGLPTIAPQSRNSFTIEPGVRS